MFSDFFSERNEVHKSIDGLKIKIGDRWYEAHAEEVELNGKSIRCYKIHHSGLSDVFFPVECSDGRKSVCYISNNGRYIVEKEWQE